MTYFILNNRVSEQIILPEHIGEKWFSRSAGLFEYISAFGGNFLQRLEPFLSQQVT